jgi:hypothetical protein
MVRRDRHTGSWLEAAVGNAGMRQGLRGMSWALSWAIVRTALGHDPTVEEVAEWWNENPRTTYREQAVFRRSFPTFVTPAPIFDNPEATALVQKFAISMSKSGAVKEVRALERATIRIGCMSANVEQ